MSSFHGWKEPKLVQGEETKYRNCLAKHRILIADHGENDVGQATVPAGYGYDSSRTSLVTTVAAPTMISLKRWIRCA